MIPAWLIGIGQSLVAPVTSVVTGWQDRKKAKLDQEIALAQAATEAKIRRLQTSQEADIAWEIASLNKAGWKDEWFTLLLSIPMILCFIPGMDGYVHAGFAALDQTPDWYKWAFLVAVASSFGYKKLADFMALKKGG